LETIRTIDTHRQDENEKTDGVNVVYDISDDQDIDGCQWI